MTEATDLESAVPVVAAAPESTIGAAHVSRAGVVLFTVLLPALAVLFLYHLWAFWPAPTAGGASAEKTVDYLGLWKLEVSRETVLFVVVALAGALGGLIHALRSLVTYVGHRRLLWSWAPFYLTLPVIGALGGTVFYIVFRAGLFSPSTSADEASPFGFAAVALLVGLFSEQALEKLRELAGNLFTSVPPGDDHFERVDERPRDRDAS
jgi:hypothetical protein